MGKGKGDHPTSPPGWHSQSTLHSPSCLPWADGPGGPWEDLVPPGEGGGTALRP